jgi:hypothetical protein
VADGGGARPESARERGLPVARGGGLGAVGKLGRSTEGVGEEWGREDESTRERGASGSAVARQRENGEGKRWGAQAWGCRGAWPRPAVIARQCPERGARGRREPRACAGRTERGERCLTGGPRHSAGWRCH